MVDRTVIDARGFGPVHAGEVAAGGKAPAGVDGDATVADSTITHNTAGRDGGAVHAWLGQATLTNATVEDNNAVRSVGRRQVPRTSARRRRGRRP